MWLVNLRSRIFELLARLMAWLGAGGQALYVISPVLYWLLASLLVVAMLVLLYHILITIKAAFGRPRSARRAAKLPPPPLSSPADLRRQAAQLASQADFAGALRLLYEACLRYLDQQGHLYYHPATTNGEYLREVREHPQLVTRLQPITRAMDRLCYAHVAIGHAAYERLDTLAQQLWQEAERQS